MSIDLLIDRMQSMLALIPASDPLRFFHSTYTRTTIAVRDELRAGGFADNEWVQRWDVAFASLYLDALDLWLGGETPTGPGKSPSTPPRVLTFRPCVTSCSG